MFLQRRALYNSILFNLDRGTLAPDDLAPWQKEKHREWEQEDLFAALEDLGISFPTEETFCEYGEDYISPDEMAESLTKEREPLEKDQVYLLIFELWRRLLPEKRAPSIFCDALDHQIDLYEKHELSSLEELQDDLNTLKQILDEHVDMGYTPKAVINTIQGFCSHSLETFLFDYALDLIENANYPYASELIEGFYPYLIDPIWFDYLAARITLIQTPDLANEVFEKLIGHIDRLDLGEEVLYFLSGSGLHSLFCQLALTMMPKLQLEEDFNELLKLCGKHFSYLEMHDAYEKLYAIAVKRTDDPSTQLKADDPGLLALKELLEPILAD